ncbi:MAG: hypothetical protein QNJ34_09985 [Xenococcaceae cyanobacterium MO_188.B29]|nr:hypothetical protein [Xenococcaceae cyanobacterium MO_188.B29]
MGHCIYAVILKGDLVEDLNQDIRQKNITVPSKATALVKACVKGLQQ